MFNLSNLAINNFTFNTFTRISPLSLYLNFRENLIAQQTGIQQFSHNFPRQNKIENRCTANSTRVGVHNTTERTHTRPSDWPEPAEAPPPIPAHSIEKTRSRGARPAGPWAAVGRPWPLAGPANGWRAFSFVRRSLPRATRLSVLLFAGPRFLTARKCQRKLRCLWWFCVVVGFLLCFRIVFVMVRLIFLIVVCYGWCC